jgi:hypothetical protein
MPVFVLRVVETNYYDVPVEAESAEVAQAIVQVYSSSGEMTKYFSQDKLEIPDLVELPEDAKRPYRTLTTEDVDPDELADELSA